MTKLVLSILTFFLMTGPVFAGGMEIKRKVGVYDVEVRLKRDPPVVGDNPIEIEIKDADGKCIADAKVMVNYYMPPMPRMAPMNYKIDVPLNGRKYETTMDFIMAGPWYIAIILKRDGKSLRTRFSVDAQ